MLSGSGGDCGTEESSESSTELGNSAAYRGGRGGEAGAGQRHGGGRRPGRGGHRAAVGHRRGHPRRGGDGGQAEHGAGQGATGGAPGVQPGVVVVVGADLASVELEAAAGAEVGADAALRLPPDDDGLVSLLDSTCPLYTLYTATLTWVYILYSSSTTGHCHSSRPDTACSPPSPAILLLLWL